MLLKLHTNATMPVVIPMSVEAKYQHLERRPEKATKHLCIKGRNMTVWNLVGMMQQMEWTPEETAKQYDLPVEVVHEAIAYYEANRESILAEHREMNRRMDEAFNGRAYIP